MTTEELQKIDNSGTGVNSDSEITVNNHSTTILRGFKSFLDTNGTGVSKTLTSDEFWSGSEIDKDYISKYASKTDSYMYYDPVTRTWETKSDGENTSLLDFLSGLTSSKVSNDEEQLGVSQTSAANSDGDAKTDSQTSAEKEYIEIEYETLVGDIEVIPTDSTLRVKVGDTVNLQGVGKFLSGLYFVSEIKRTVSNSSGFSLTFTLYKNGFGALKNADGAVPASDTRYVRIPVADNINISSLAVGDKVRIVGETAVYAHAHDGVRVPNWVKQKVLTVDAISDDGHTVRLMPIWSWTYTKFLQLV